MGNISTLNSSSKVSAILTKYPNLCRPPSDFVEAKHSVKHYIPTRGQSIHSKARRLDSQRLTLAKAEFQYMLNNGIIRPSNSPWASPLHLVSKKDESLRPCGDYRRLNAVTLPDRYPIPRLDDFHHILKGTRVYSKIDLCKAFYQIPIAEEDKPKTAIITPFGLFEFNVMSFGLRNATATFQRFMHEVLRNLDFAFVYLDDILVASKTEEEHYSHLETLFSRLNSYGLRINLSKSKFLVQEIDFLGYLITSHGVKPLPTKVKAILEYKKPKTVHELRIFLGMLNFYRTFLNNAAETQAILHEYLRGAKKKDRSEIKWTEEAEVQFEKCKQALANTALLAYPDTELPISLCTDASDRAVGSVLQQLDNNNWKPIAFFSKKLNPAQCNYSTYDRELLAIYLSIKFFKHLLEAREFTILTDHKPLIYAFKQKNEKASPKQLRHLQYISQFTTDIKYIKGTDNIVADALSRVDAITTIDYEEIAKEQTGDSELQNLISKNTSLKFKQCPLQSGNLLWCDVSTNNIRPFIPIKFRMLVFRNFHELSHPGIKATTKQLTSRFIWPNMNKDIRKWARACVNCQKCKVSIHTKSEIMEDTILNVNIKFNIRKCIINYKLLTSRISTVAPVKLSSVGQRSAVGSQARDAEGRRPDFLRRFRKKLPSQTGAQYSAVEKINVKAEVRRVLASLPQEEPASLWRILLRDDSFPFNLRMMPKFQRKKKTTITSAKLRNGTAKTIYKQFLIMDLYSHTGEKPFKCEHCDYCTIFKHALKDHLRTHTGEKLFKCEHCDFRTSYERSLKAHLRTHTGEKPFKCEYCDYRAIEKKNLVQHLRTHTGEKPFKCEHCDYRTSFKHILKLHLRNHTGEKPFKCEQCDFHSSYKGSLKRHLRTHTGEKPLKCEYCDYRAIEKNNLVQHLRTHTGEKPFKCDHCDYRTSLKHSLKLHLSTHTGEKPFKCEHCDFRTSYERSLKAHLHTHTGEKPFKCEYCDYRAIEKYNLVQHLHNHTGEKPFKCEHCDYRTSFKPSLKLHLRTHTGEKPFKCEHCDYRTSFKHSLDSHLRNHTGEKPFKCEHCDYSTSVKTRLQVHLRIHTGEKPFKCEQCDFRSSYKGNLKKHLRTHTCEKPLKCEHCDYRTSFKHSLDLHLSTHTAEKLFKCEHVTTGLLET
ncbi:hypothetical protein LAZ67_3006141 [Cordylochernes scorpioides]|uniref:Transposon Ty3-I Gag-Pol polyprotein n=1 Tax=Cordylochernes scorpioides TaxID=51811 RepID=A0ABY6KB38_9ARAC|nr:hypothetical protein LAZ67_3006141 [Cordylochernes scorpioides]